MLRNSFFFELLILAALGVSCSHSSSESADRLPPGYTDIGHIELEEVLTIGEEVPIVLRAGETPSILLFRRLKGGKSKAREDIALIGA